MCDYIPSISDDNYCPTRLALRWRNASRKKERKDLDLFMLSVSENQEGSTRWYIFRVVRIDCTSIPRGSGRDNPWDV